MINIMAKSRPQSPVSTVITTNVKSGPGGRRYTTRVEKQKPQKKFDVQTKFAMESALPDEIELNGKYFTRAPGILKILELVISVLCMIFLSPPTTWFTRSLCAVVAITFALTVFVCLFYLFTLRRVVFPKWPWIRIEMLYAEAAALGFFVTSILQLVFTNREDYKISLMRFDYYHDYLVAGILGLINSFIYAIDRHMLKKQWLRYIATRPKVSIVRATVNKRGNTVTKTVTRYR